MLEAYEGMGTYGPEHRELLMSHLEDPEQRKHPWPATLDSAFGIDDPSSACGGPSAKAASASATSAKADEKDLDSKKGKSSTSSSSGSSSVNTSGGGGEGKETQTNAEENSTEFSSSTSSGINSTAAVKAGVTTASTGNKSTKRTKTTKTTKSVKSITASTHADDDAGATVNANGGRTVDDGVSQNNPGGVVGATGVRGQGGGKSRSRGGRGGKGGVGGVSSGGVAGAKRSVFGRGAEGAGMVLLGSPMVDATLEDTHGLRAVIEVLKREMGGGSAEGEGGEGGQGEGEGGGRVVLKMEVLYMLRMY